jgi:hypothetical protein
MQVSKSKLVVSTLVSALLAFATGCGTAGTSNNDQGVAFTLLGFFDAEDTDTGITGLSVPLSTVPEEEQQNSGAILATLGVQNNLTGQFIRTDRALISYYIEGATIQPPDTTIPFSGVLGPTQSDDDPPVPVDPTLPGEFEENQLFGEIPVVPPAIMTFLNLNRAQLPELPFVMEVIVNVSGVTSSGDRLETNQQTLTVLFTPDAIIPPEGTDGGGGTDTDTDTDTATGDPELVPSDADGEGVVDGGSGQL